MTYEGEWKCTVNLPMKIIVENRANSRVSLSRKGIRIRLSSRLSEPERKKQILEFRKWIEKKIENDPGRFAPRKVKKYRSGDVLAINDSSYTLQIDYRNKKNHSVRLRGGTIHLSLSMAGGETKAAGSIPALLSRCIGKDHLPFFRERIEALNAKHFRKKIGRISFKYNKSNWGSCSTRGNINLSTRLLFVPRDVQEYVLVHELCHLVENNHSPRFWKLVGKIIPDYGRKRNWLKRNGDKCYF